MAGKNINQFNIPDEVENPNWQQWQIDSGVDYAIYGGDEAAEGKYINRNQVSQETAAEAKALRERLSGIGGKALRLVMQEAQPM